MKSSAFWNFVSLATLLLTLSWETAHGQHLSESTLASQRGTLSGLWILQHYDSQRQPYNSLQNWTIALSADRSTGNISVSVLKNGLPVTITGAEVGSKQLKVTFLESIPGGSGTRNATYTLQVAADDELTGQYSWMDDSRFLILQATGTLRAIRQGSPRLDAFTRQVGAALAAKQRVANPGASAQASGSPQKYCPQCNGRKVRACYACGGSGRYSGGVCAACGGKGEVRCTALTCPF